MRIRKNARLSGFLYPNTNLLTENNLCQLNQSPWDILTFSSSDSSSSFHRIIIIIIVFIVLFDNYEVCYNVNYAGNGSSLDSIGDFESVAIKTSGSGEHCSDYNEVIGFKIERKKHKVEEEIKLCDRLDTKGWQCGSAVKNGNTMCDCHLSELQSYYVWTTEKKLNLAHSPTSGCRVPRPKKRPKSNPHEFYYYTGFGPSWGKKRGTIATTSGIDNDMDVQEERGRRIKPDISVVGPMELDFFDDDNNKKGKLGITGKKKRKPVKERSLKSLM